MAATHYSLLANCDLEGINPFEYLRDVLSRSPNLAAKDLAKLTPRRWKAARDTGDLQIVTAAITANS